MSVVWVTGAHGFIGRHLARHLANEGLTVFGIGHGHWPEHEAARWGLHMWLNGALEPANLDLLVERGGLPSVVYHLAGGASVGASLQAPLEDFTRTVDTGAQLFDWLRRRAPEAAVVIVSSAAVYGAGYSGPIPTTVLPRPFSPYGHHKLMLEQLARSYAEGFGLRSAVVRLFSVYGPWLYKQLLWDLCSRLNNDVQELQLGGDGGELRDWTEVQDVVRLLYRAGDAASIDVPIINGGSGVATPVRDVAEIVVRSWGANIPVCFSGLTRQGDPYSLVSSPCIVNGEPFLWRSSVSEGVAAYVDWFRKAAS